MLAQLGSISLDGSSLPCKEVLILDRDDRPASNSLAGALEAAGTAVTHLVLEDAREMLDVPTEDAIAPEAHIDAIVGWIAPTVLNAAPLHDAVTLNETGNLCIGIVDVEESVVTLGPNDLVAIRCAPNKARADAATVVFLNSGSEPHIGSGRAWVEFSRRLAPTG